MNQSNVTGSCDRLYCKITPIHYIKYSFLGPNGRMLKEKRYCRQHFKNRLIEIKRLLSWKVEQHGPAQ